MRELLFASAIMLIVSAGLAFAWAIQALAKSKPQRNK
jgi:hypothetical protein